MDMDLVREIAVVLNVRSRENASNTPDFVLAEYMVGCLQAYEEAVNRRHNRRDNLKLGEPVPVDRSPGWMEREAKTGAKLLEDMQKEARTGITRDRLADRCNDLS